MKKAILLIFLTGIIVSENNAQNKIICPLKQKQHQSHKRIDLKLNMRKLWEDHITYTRNYIISALADLPDLQAIAQRLLRNQDDIGQAIVPVYGPKAGKKLSGLLRDHILIATEVVKAAKENNKAELDSSSQKWYANADDIAQFLSSANPHWDETTLKDMLYKHLDFTTGEVVSRLGNKWNDDISFYDKGHVHMLMFSDYLVDGILKQFPDKF